MSNITSELFASNGVVFCIPNKIFIFLLILVIFALIGIILLSTSNSETLRVDYDIKVYPKPNMGIISLVYKDLPLNHRETIPKIFIHDRVDTSGNNLYSLCSGRGYQPYEHNGVWGYRFSNNNDRVIMVNETPVANLGVVTGSLARTEADGFIILSRGFPIEKASINNIYTVLLVRK